MTTTVLMQLAAGAPVPNQVVGMPSGATYTPNAQNQVLANPKDVNALEAAGFVIATTGLTPGAVYNTNTATAAATLSGANITGGSDVLLGMTGTLSANAALTLPTVANLIAALPNPQPGQSYKLRILNDGSGYQWTVTTNTGWTLAGTMTIANNTWRDFIVTLTSLTAAVLQDVGAGTAP